MRFWRRFGGRYANYPSRVVGIRTHRHRASRSFEMDEFCTPGHYQPWRFRGQPNSKRRVSPRSATCPAEGQTGQVMTKGWTGTGFATDRTSSAVGGRVEAPEAHGSEGWKRELGYSAATPLRFYGPKRPAASLSQSPPHLTISTETTASQGRSAKSRPWKSTWRVCV